MIIDFLLDILTGLLVWLMTLRPAWEWELPNEILIAMKTIFSLDPYLPVTEAFLCMSLVVTVFSAMLAFKWGIKIVDWIADVLP